MGDRIVASTVRGELLDKGLRLYDVLLATFSPLEVYKEKIWVVWLLNIKLLENNYIKW